MCVLNVSSYMTFFDKKKAHCGLNDQLLPIVQLVDLLRKFVITKSDNHLVILQLSFKQLCYFIANYNVF